jgi:hypothetical protein
MNAAIQAACDAAQAARRKALPRPSPVHSRAILFCAFFFIRNHRTPS